MDEKLHKNHICIRLAAAIKVERKQVHLGTADSQKEAAHLYDRFVTLIPQLIHFPTEADCFETCVVNMPFTEQRPFTERLLNTLDTLDT